MSNVKFPALVFPFSGRTVVVARDASFFMQTTRSQLKADFFKVPFRIVDSNGIEYCAERLIEQGGIGPFGGWNLFLNRALRIEVSIRLVGTTSIQQVRKWVLTALRDDPTGVWLGGELVPDELCDKINVCALVSEVIGVLD